MAFRSLFPCNHNTLSLESKEVIPYYPLLSSLYSYFPSLKISFTDFLLFPLTLSALSSFHWTFYMILFSTLSLAVNYTCGCPGVCNIIYKECKSTFNYIVPLHGQCRNLRVPPSCPLCHCSHSFHQSITWITWYTVTSSILNRLLSIN